MNNIKNILFVVCISFFAMVFTSEKPQSDDDSLSESGVFESGWENHLNALWQDKYWKEGPLELKGQKEDSLVLKEQWINSAVKAAMNEGKSLNELSNDLNGKLINVLNNKFKLSFGLQGIFIDLILKDFEKKFYDREKKRDEGQAKFLLLLKEIKNDWSGALNLEWKKNILTQIKDLIQLNVKGSDIADQITTAITNYNANRWYGGYGISNDEKKSILDYINDMETVRDFRLRQLSTSELTQSDIIKEQQSENTKVQRKFKRWLSAVGEKVSNIWPAYTIKKAPEHIIEIAKDLIDIYKNPQIVVDKINEEFDRKEESLNKNAGLFTSNSEKIEEINQIKTNIINNIMDYLRNYEREFGIRKEAKMLQQQKRKESQKIEEFKQNLQNEQQAQPLIQKEIQKEDLSSRVQEIAQKIGKQKSFLTEEQQKQWEIKNKKWKEEENDAMIRIKKRLEKKEGHTGLEAEVFKKELSEEERQQRWERVPKQKTRLKRFFEYQRLKKEKPLQQNILPQQNILLMKQIEYK